MQISILLAGRTGAPLQGFPGNEGNNADFTHQFDRVISSKRWRVLMTGENRDFDVRQLMVSNPPRECVCYWIPVIKRLVLGRRR